MAMPVHPHFADLAVFGLAENGAAGVHPLSRAAPAVGAAELGREPGTGNVHLAGLERRLRLVGRYVFPIGADRLQASALLTERRLEEYGGGREHGGDLLHGTLLPAVSKRIQQLAIRVVHGAQYTPIRNLGSGRMVHGSGRRPLSPVTRFFSQLSTQEDGTMLKRILATTAVLALCAL